MKKTVTIALILLLSVLFSLPCFAQVESKYIIDDANLLSDNEEKQLLDSIEDLQSKYGCDIVIHTTPDTDGKDIADYCEDYYDNGEYADDGLIFVISMADSDYYTLANGALADILPDYKIDDICESIVPYLSDGDFYNAFSEYLGNLDTALADSQPDASDYLLREVIVIAGSVAVALVIVTIFKKKMNTAVMQRNADSYVVNGSFNLTNSRDVFITSHIHRRAINKNNGSHSGGGSVKRSGSGGKF